MRAPITGQTGLILAVALAVSLPAGASALAQELPPADQAQLQPQPTATGAELRTTVAPTGDLATLPKGPDIKGVISRRSADRIEITADDGSKTIVNVNDLTRIRSSKGLFGMSRQQLAANALLNGLPVLVHTLQSGDALMAADIQFKDKDLKIANMIRTGTKQGFEEQSAATAEVRAMTEALRSRFADIDEFNIKSTTNVNFASGKTALTEQGKADLCNVATQAQGIRNAVMLVAGYVDSKGIEEPN